MEPINNKNQQADPDKWIDKQDVLLKMNISSRTLFNWRKNNILPFTKLGGKIYYRESDLKAMLEMHASRPRLAKGQSNNNKKDN